MNSFSQTTPPKPDTHSPSIKVVEKVSKKGSEVVIPYEKYILPNGLTVILHEDHSDPIVHVDVTYHVGSAREEISKSGFAHFFEHMMFQGSDNVGDEQHFKIVTEAGGTLNGTTNTDRTNYFETLPSNQLEVALWLESDRMGFFLDAVTQKKFEIQRATVKNERGQNYDNRPYGLAHEKICQALFPYGHPYSWLTIGYIEDLNRSNVEDLKKFFMRWYGPNNATLTVAGDMNPGETLNLVQKYFGSIPKGPAVSSMPKELLKLDKDRYISYEDNIRFPMLSVVFPSVPSFHADEAPLDVLADIIGGEKNSIMYKNFIKSEKAQSANAMNPTMELSGMFELTVRTLPETKLSEVEAMVREAIAEFEKRGVTDEDLKRFKATYESSTIQSLASVSGKASRLASFQTFQGNPNLIGKDLERYQKVTREDVIRVFNQYIKGKHAVVLSVYPKGKPELAAKPDDFKPATEGEAMFKTDYSGMVYNKAKDNFDRSKKPVPGPAPLVSVPDYWTENFTNGIKVIGARNTEIPTVTISLAVEMGHRYEEKAKSGVTYMLGELMNEGTEKYSSEAFSAELEKLGSEVSIWADNQNLNIYISCLLKNLDATLALAEERIFHSKLDEADFNRLKKMQLQNIANQVTQPTAIAGLVYNKLLYGSDHIMSVPTIGTEETVKNMTLEDVKSYKEKMFSPSIANLVIVGDIDKAGILPKIAFLQKWAPKQVSSKTIPGAPKIDKTKIYLVDKDKAPQSEVRIGYISMPFDATGDFYKSGIMNYVLGGAFNSRINLNLREDKGWTYGARSGFSGDKIPGPFTASGGIKGDATDGSIVEFLKEMNAYREKGITEEELSFTKNSMGQRDALKYETAGQKAQFLRQIIQYNLSKDFVKKQTEILQGMTKAEIDALAKKYLPTDKMIILVVGDSKSVKDKLLKLNYEVVDLDLSGNKKM